MKLLSSPEVILSSPDPVLHYFAWPTVARLKDGRLACACSGFRKRHICPFGKAVIQYSSDEAVTWSPAEPVIDTALDDRDAGLLAFGKSGLLVTSFNNTAAMQRQWAQGDEQILERIAQITPEEEQRDLGSTWRVSLDNGHTFGPVYHCPVTSPHGPLEMPDGTILWVGRIFSEEFRRNTELNVYRLSLDGTSEYVGCIEDVSDEKGPLLNCEPHAVVLPDGSLLCHIRVQREREWYTTFQSVSVDGGKTWSKPVQLLSRFGGAPAHLLVHSSGTIISTYGYREAPFGVRAMLSRDGGQTWETDVVLYDNQGVSIDLGYPATAELSDGSMVTVFYAHENAKSPAEIWQVKWNLD